MGSSLYRKGRNVCVCVRGEGGRYIRRFVGKGDSL